MFALNGVNSTNSKSRKNLVQPHLQELTLLWFVSARLKSIIIVITIFNLWLLVINI